MTDTDEDWKRRPGPCVGPNPGPREYQGGTVAMADGNDLISLVQKVSREAQHASKTCGRKELDALQVTAQQFLKLYQELKARGVIE
jgi:hypothetical protein